MLPNIGVAIEGLLPFREKGGRCVPPVLVAAKLALGGSLRIGTIDDFESNDKLEV
jgi:hypothetical protein